MHAYVCVLWAVFVQFLLVWLLHYTYCSGTGQPISTDPYRSGISRPVKLCSCRRSGRTDSIRFCCYECYQHSQFIEDNTEPSFLPTEFTWSCRTYLRSPDSATLLSPPVWAKMGWLVLWMEDAMWPENLKKLDKDCSLHTRDYNLALFGCTQIVVQLWVEQWAHWMPQLVVVEKSLIADSQQPHVHLSFCCYAFMCCQLSCCTLVQTCSILTVAGPFWLLLPILSFEHHPLTRSCINWKPFWFSDLSVVSTSLDLKVVFIM